MRDQTSGPDIIIRDQLSDTEIVVAISGEIATPGVYTLPAGSRVNDALGAAGGTTSDADLSGLNLAARLDDESQIVVPSIRKQAAATGATPVAIGIRAAVTETATRAAAEVGSDSDLIDINSATANELEELPGIGEAIAQRIIEDREANGPYPTKESLARVEGISAAMVQEFEDQITVGP